MDIFAKSPLPQLERALNRDTLSQSVIAQNIANVDTPGYKSKNVAFSDVLQNAFQAKKTEQGHLSFSGGNNNTRVVTDRSTTMQNNGNNVDVDKEMSKLAKTQIDDQALVAAVNHQLQQYKLVIGGGR